VDTAGEEGLAARGDETGVETAGEVRHGREDALHIHHQHLHRARHDRQLLMEMIAGHLNLVI
jgi:hypothetical protein